MIIQLNDLRKTIINTDYLIGLKKGDSLAEGKEWCVKYAARSSFELFLLIEKILIEYYNSEDISKAYDLALADYNKLASILLTKYKKL